MSQVLEQVAAASARIRKERHGAWAALVLATADADDVDAEAAVETMERCGKSPEDLAADVALVLKRRQLRSAVEAGDRAEAALCRIAADRAAADRAQEEAQRRHQAALAPLAAEEAAARLKASAAGRARRELLQTAPPELRGRQADLSRRRADLAAKRAGLAKEIRDDAARLSTYEGWEAKEARKLGQPPTYEKEVAGCQMRSDKAKAAVEAILRQEAELEREGAALREAMLHAA
jgi:colicin import membrane protein